MPQFQSGKGPGEARDGRHRQFPANTCRAPDLSLMAKARAGFHGPYGLGINQLFKGIGGPEYLVAVLTGYTGEEKEEAGELFYENHAFPGGWIKMPPPLSDDQVTYADGTAATVENMSQDFAAFAMWAARAEDDGSQGLGLQGRADADRAGLAAVSDPTNSCGPGSRAKTRLISTRYDCRRPARRGLLLLGVPGPRYSASVGVGLSSSASVGSGGVTTPSATTEVRLAKRRASCGSWVTSSTVVPASSAISATSASRSAFSAGPSAPKGSSSSSKGRACNSARPKSARPAVLPIYPGLLFPPPSPACHHLIDRCRCPAPPQRETGQADCAIVRC